MSPVSLSKSLLCSSTSSHIADSPHCKCRRYFRAEKTRAVFRILVIVSIFLSLEQVMTYLGQFFKQYGGKRSQLSRMNSSPVLLTSQQKALFKGTNPHMKSLFLLAAQADSSESSREGTQEAGGRAKPALARTMSSAQISRGGAGGLKKPYISPSQVLFRSFSILLF